MTTTRTSLITGFAIAAFGLISSAAAQPLTPGEAANVANGLPAPRCSRPLDDEATRANRLVELVQETRAAMEKDPLLWATFKYYENELAATRRCLQSASASRSVVR